MNVTDKFLEGKHLGDEGIIDHHMHIGMVAPFYSCAFQVESLFAKMNLIGIQAGIISCIAGSGDFQEGNRDVERAVRTYPGRFFGSVMLNPKYPDEIEEELYRCWDTGCFRGIKLHPVLNGYPINGEHYCRIYKIAAELNCPVLIHTWGTEDIRQFADLASRFDSTVFILAHSGGEIPAVLEASKLARKYPRIYLDTACSWTYYGLLEAMVKEAGSRKVLFGSDAMWNSIEAALGRVVLSNISESEKREIISLNARRLFSLEDL